MPTSRPAPPALAVRLLRMAVRDERAAEAILGDLHEEYIGRAGPRRRVAAGLWYWASALMIALRYLLHRSPPVTPPRRAWPGAGDLRVALRSLSRAPVFAITAALTLGIGVGGTVAMFSVVNGVMLQPLPYADPGALLAVWQTAPGIDADRFPLSPATYFTWRQEHHAVEAVAIWKYRRFTVDMLAADPELVDGWLLTEEAFGVLRVEPRIGRGFVAEDMRPGGPLTVVLADGYWRRRFGADPGVVGRHLAINGDDATIIGVLPRRFHAPEGPEPSVFVPARFSPDDIYVGYYSFNGLARLAPKATIADAEREAVAVIPRAIDAYGGTTAARAAEMQLSTLVTPLKEEIIGDTGRIIWILFGTVSLVLVIACANVATLVLARAEGRHREIAVRRALGATGPRIAGHYLAEGLALGAVGGGLGLVAAVAALGYLRRRAPAGLPRIDAIGIDPSVLGFAFVVTLGAAAVFSLVPALAGRADLLTPLKESAPSVGAGRRRLRGRNVLVSLEIALAVVLLVAAGLMIRTVGYLRSIDPGFRDPETVLTGRLYVPPFVVQEPERVAQIQRALLGRLAAIPGVEAAGAATAVGTENWVWVNSVHVRERLRPEEAAQPMRRLVWIAGAFLEAMETRLLAGRTFDDGEMEGGRPVALVSAGFAAEFWDDPAKAIGSHVALRRDGSWQEIVGVVEDVRAAGLDAAAPAMVYFPAFSRTLFGEPWVQRDLRFVVKSASRDPSTLGPTLREVGRTAAPGVPLTDIRTAADIVSASMARTTFITTMLTVAGALALFLGGIGVYGVIAYLVALRTRELGLRLALGATTRDVGWLMLRHGGALAIGGVVAGLAVSAAATRVLRAVLVGVQPLDPATYLAVAGGLLACAFLASAIPAVRAARVDPAATLRAE